jgi:hypothetical protein
VRVIAVAVLVVAVAAASAVAADDEIPTRDCRTRAESGRAPLPFLGASSVVAGPIAFWGLARAGQGLGEHGEDGRFFAKAAASVRAGRAVVLSVPKRFRARLALRYARGGTESSEVRFVPCAPSTRAFSYRGRVGRVTGFPGGFVLTRPGCYPLDVRVEGGRTHRVRVAFGYPCR